MTVTTYTGKKAPKRECKKIKGSYYLIGDVTKKDSGECYLVEGKYHRFNNGYIEYDHEKGRYVLIHKTTLREGIVDFDKTFIKGFFSPNITKNINIGDGEGSKSLCISEEVAKKAGYRERLSTGTFFKKNDHPSGWFTKILKAPISKNSLQYESRFVSNLTESEFNKSFDPKYDNEQLNILGDFLHDHGITFGLEFETSLGYIPERLCYRYGLIPLRDGSIPGLEYVTIPLSGRKGLYALKEICKEMSKRTKFDTSCALHLHLGGLDRDEGSILSAFILACLVQDEMFLCQPKYKRGNGSTSHGGFCKPLEVSRIFGSLPKKIRLDEIKKYFSKVFRFIADGRDYENYRNSLDNVETHPSDPSGQRKWEIQSRYFWVNFVPILFGNKKTLEFRQHHITNDFEKIINFLFSCAVFVWTAKNCKDEIFDESSELFTMLIKKPNMSTEILTHNLLKKGNSQLVEITNRHNKYTQVRKDVMLKIQKSTDKDGSNENKYDSMYDDVLEKNFW